MGVILFHLDTRDLSDAHGFETWRDYCASHLDVYPSDSAQNTAWHGAVDAAVVSGFLVSRVFSERHRHRRWGLKSGSDPELLLVRLFLDGGWFGRHGETPVLIQPGDVEILTLREELVAETSTSRQISLYLPWDRVGYLPDRDPSHVKLARGTLSARLLTGALTTLSETIGGSEGAEAQAVANGFAGLLSGLAFSRSDDAGASLARQGMISEMRDFIRRNLRSPGLGVDAICREFGASRATVYRLFESEGGVASFIKRERLDCAFRALMVKPASRGRVRSVGEQWGFSEPASFNRSFKRQFGISPSEVVALGGLGRLSSKHRSVVKGGSVVDPATNLSLAPLLAQL